MADSPEPSSLPRSAPGGVRAVVEASAAAAARGDPATLALVLETEGSTYVRAGALALFGAREGQVGWLSGGCIEPEIEQRAAEAATSRGIGWMDIDTRSDEDLFAGSAPGCRGRLRLALLPLAALREWPALIDEWRRGHGDLRLDLQAGGALAASVGDERQRWTLPAAPLPWAAGSDRWRLEIAAPPSVLVLGAGPETPTLLPLLRTLGWMTTLVTTPRWSCTTTSNSTARRWSSSAAIAARRSASSACSARSVAATTCSGCCRRARANRWRRACIRRSAWRWAAKGPKRSR